MRTTTSTISPMDKEAAASNWSYWRPQQSSMQELTDSAMRSFEPAPTPLPEDIPMPIMGGDVAANKLALTKYLEDRDASMRVHPEARVHRHAPLDYKVGIEPATRPLSGPLADRNVYSDRGRFWRVTLPGGRVTTVYLRDGAGAPNLGVPSERWNTGEANDISAILYSSGLTRPDGTVAGAPIGKAIKEIISHDVMDRGWIDNLYNRRVMALLGLAGNKLENAGKMTRNAFARIGNAGRSLFGMRPKWSYSRIEKNPTAAADIRGADSSWKEKLIHGGAYEEQLDDEALEREERVLRLLPLLRD